MSKRKLILEDGTTLVGEAFGSERVTEGEVIFNTGMTGYQEIMSDPNYLGHIAVMTYPSIGSYGINRDDFESITPFINGIITKEVNDEPSNFRSEETLDAFMKRHQIPGIAGIDTRMLTRLLRDKGSMRGMITDASATFESVQEVLKKEETSLLVEKTSITKPYIVPGEGARVVIIDLGMKQTILHELTNLQCHVTVVPYDTSAEDILRFKPDGVLLSNGPGNPTFVQTTIETVQALLGEIPIFGIGLGHQIFAQACGANITKLNHGNYGNSFPVKDLAIDKTWITTQSRQYYVAEASIENTDLTVTFRSLNDDTVEGLKHKKFDAFSVQFNPEGAPGSNDTKYLFEQFIEMMKQNRVKNGGQQHA